MREERDGVRGQVKEGGRYLIQKALRLEMVGVHPESNGQLGQILYKRVM